MEYLTKIRVAMLLLFTVALTGCFEDEYLPYSTSKFTPDSSINSFEMIGGVGDNYGTWVMFFKGTFNDVDFAEKLDLIDSCKFNIKIKLKNKEFSYDLNQSRKESYTLSETEKCVILYMQQLNALMVKKAKNINSYQNN